MAPPTITHVSECYIKPLHNLPSHSNQPIHFTPFELVFLNANYSQKGLLFAKPPHDNQDFSIAHFLDRLRRTLSATLDHFYPLAGRLATRKETSPPSYVIYLDPGNGPGVKFVHAIANVAISDVVTSSDVPLAHSFFDLNNAINHDGHTLPLLSIQVTELVDGIFIGGTINHVVADGTTFWRFMATWSEIFQSNTRKDVDFISSSQIYRRTVIEGCDPIINLPYTNHNEFIDQLKSPQLKETFFNFSSYSTSKLKAKANAECNTQTISSLQALCALLWRCITRARRAPLDTETTCKLAISNRQRLNPPLPDDYFGNPVQLVKGTAKVAELMDHGLGWAALRLHEAVRSHDDTEVRKWVGSWCKSPSIMKLSGVFDPNCVSVGSSPRFDMYGCEFGLGKAVAARSGCANKGDGKITMFPGRDGGGSMGVEVCLLPEYMMAMVCDEEFISALNGDI